MCTLKEGNNYNTKRHEKGFTLIEMSIVMIIVGILIATFSPLYSAYLRNQDLVDTTTTVQTVTSAVGSFRAQYGRYPCPASSTATRNDADYGHETDCEDEASIAVANCDAGICIEESSRAITFSSGGAPVTITPRIRVGTIPFRELNLQEKDALDGHSNRLLYAVTERLAVKNTFSLDEGGIAVLNDKDLSAIDPPGSAHFIIISHGENGAGARTKGGQLNACPGAGLENDNCNVGGQAIYRVAQTETTGDAEQFDDIISYFTSVNIPLWERSAINEFHIHQRPSGDVGIGNFTSEIFERDEIKGIAYSSGALQTTEFCDEIGANCFPSSLIGGQIIEGPPGEFTNSGPNEGLVCPVGTYMIGITNGAPDCVNDINVTCPTDEILEGIRADGSLDCAAPPPAACTAQNVDICGTPVPFPFLLNNQSFTAPQQGFNRVETHRCRDGIISFRNGTGNCAPPADCPAQNKNVCGNPVAIPPLLHGDSFPASHPPTRVVNYECNDGALLRRATSGFCNCPGDNVGFEACERGPAGIGGFTGPGITTTTSFDCTTGNPLPPVTTGSCTCEPGLYSETIGLCPANFTGNIVEQEIQVCGVTPFIRTDIVSSLSDCVCNNPADLVTDTNTCPPGFRIGSLGPFATRATRVYNCDPQNPGFGPATTINNCVCEPDSTIRPFSCPPNLNRGQILKESTRSCSPTNVGTWSPFVTLPDAQQTNPCRCEPENRGIWNPSCRGALTGTYTTSRDFICQSDTSLPGQQITQITANNCACPPPQQSSRACDSNLYNTGTILTERRIDSSLDCNNIPLTTITASFGGFVDIPGGDSCNCVESTERNDEACPAEFNIGRRHLIKEFRCDTVPIGDTGWQIDTALDTCACDSSVTDTRQVTCPAGEVGFIEETGNFNCSTGNFDYAEVSRTCSLPTYHWTSDSSPQISAGGGAERLNSVCDLSVDAGRVVICDRTTGNSGQFRLYDNCTCR